MTKRFVYYTHKGHDYILDTPRTHLDFIEMLGDTLSTEEIVDLLNKQDKQIQRLESRLSIATQLLKQFKLYYIFMDKLEDVEEIHHWSKEEGVTDD